VPFFFQKITGFHHLVLITTLLVKIVAYSGLIKEASGWPESQHGPCSGNL